MASSNQSYDTAVEVRTGAFDSTMSYLLDQFTAWAAPRLRKLAAFLFAEFARGVIAVLLLGFALVAAIYGTIYFVGFLVEVLDIWLPHWAATGIVAALMLLPAGGAALIGLWQVSKMRSVRAGGSLAAKAGGLLWNLARGKQTQAGKPW
ncbi:phage holin family protein [Nocardia huaxiensis]|uniref:Phage holin family protein n=1 Tax=Nocardia huaxiensis TaxID=2755382 RepID=A0A7D6ZN15_9NOCA|nr:phage holin family protein [Nocardia huaxiensis]QLY29525.1 phage holin family protein [Nocardia huaxiensis]UFS96917.1 phage holin family protein [Nocardia huaxiensis]